MLCTGSECGKSKVKRILRLPYPIQIMINQKQPENVEYFNRLGKVITNDLACTREIKYRVAMSKAAFKKKKKKKKKNFFNSKLRKKCYI